MNDLFQQNETKAVLLVDAENVFNSIDKKAILHEISITCPVILIFVSNCYLVLARLYVFGNKDIKKEQHKMIQRPL